MDGSTFVRRLLDRRRGAARPATRRAAIVDAAALVFDRDWRSSGGLRDDGLGASRAAGYWSRNHSHIAQSIPLEDALVEDPIQVMFNGGVDDDAARSFARGCRAEVQAGYAVSDDRVRASRLFAGRCDVAGGDEGSRARVARGAAGIEPRRGDGRSATTSTISRCSSSPGTPVVMANAVDEPQVTRLARAPLIRTKPASRRQSSGSFYDADRKPRDSSRSKNTPICSSHSTQVCPRPDASLIVVGQLTFHEPTHELAIDGSSESSVPHET